jgi:WD40 repeat protein
VESATNLTALYTLNQPELRKAAFSPDGKLFAVSSGNQENFGVKIWRSATGELYQSYEDYTGIVWDAAFSPDGALLATASDDTGHQGLKVWRLSDHALVKSLGGLTTTSSVAFSPDGKYLAVGGLEGWPNGVVWLYDLSTWIVKHKFVASGQNVTAVRFFADSSSVAAGGTGGGIYAWSANTGKLGLTFNGGKQANSIAISPKTPEGKALLASTTCSQTGTYGCTTGGVSVWDLVQMNQVVKFDDAAESVDFSPDGKLLVSGSGANDPNIRIRSVSNWALLATLPGPAYSAVFSPDGLYLATVNFTSVTIWGVKS